VRAGGPLRAAVLGLGVGEQHARAYVREPATVLRWVFDLQRDRMDRLVAELGQGAAAMGWQQILSDGETDIVSIATYDDQHAQQTVEALRAGKNVFVEKPLCRTLDEVRAIRDAWAASRRQLACNLVLRAAPLYRWLKDAVRAGELGEVYAFDGDYLYGRLHKITEGWRRDVDGYSVTQGGGVHLVDLMLWTTGQRPSRVSAVGNRVCTEGTAFRYDDFVAATFEFDSGMVGRISSNFGCVHRHQHVVRVFGTEGTFVYDDAGPRIHRSREGTAEPIELAPVPATKGDLIPSFVESISDGKKGGLLSAQHEFDLMAACIAVDRALGAGVSQPIEYP
jgi:predicted dehydrogenase